MTTQTPNTRHRSPRPGERCTCGRPAVTVYQTAHSGDVPYCGIPDGGQGSPTAAEVTTDET